MRNFPIDCDVIFTRPDDQHHGKIGKIVSERSPTGRYSIDVGNTRVMRHGDDICEASEFMKEKAMQKELIETPEKQLVPAIDLEQLVINTNAIIKIDVDLSIQYIDFRVASFTGESEELEAELKKWYKDFAARRLELTRPVNESLKQVIADEKKIGDYLDKIFADNKAKREAAEAERKKAKYAEVMTTMADMLNSVDLPPEYLAKVVFREEYYNKTMVNKKLADSIQAQIDDQVKMYNGWKAEQELKQQKIKNRELLIDNYNTKYGFDAKYSQMPVEMYSDEQVIELFERKNQQQEQAKLAQIEKEKQDAQKAQEQAKLAQIEKEKQDAQKAQEQAKATQAVDTSNNQISEGETRESVSVQSNERSNVADNARNDGVSGSKSELRESQPILSDSTPSLTFRISGGSVNSMRFSMKSFAEKFGYTVEEI